ncbi:MAG: hypothetical protein H0A75_07100 [Candidatus Methanofishera endochildressiae]|uniref:Potassium channel domain-containing protein n=1 Tax=Candidatus Methanofishera endochildressiae TaxID=2738884 RepID=A0A7Z0SD81_9GAMM|nr:hypothetical protein [Candidatus Methanofishera endochildressiae]
MAWCQILQPVIEGESTYLSIFHAFYFMTYTATTTGFGEIPFAFSDAQRLWAIVCLYVSVVTWFYALGSIIRLFQNVPFKRALDDIALRQSYWRVFLHYLWFWGYR